tara:strand:- start:295 stop:972 length:678 start_codon:yes stop_codon:yes gene_type:complete
VGADLETLEMLQMTTIKKLMGFALLTGSMTAATALPSAAQSYSQGSQGGYVVQNTQGYATGHNGGRSYHDRHNNRWDRHDRNHGGWDRNHRRHDRWDRHDNRRDYYRGRHDDHSRHNSWNRGHFYYGYPNYGYRPSYNYRPRYSWNPSQRVVYAPHFTNRHYRPRYPVGGHFHDWNRHRINDYHRWGLYQPPNGYYWVRHNNDAYLAAAGTGLVAGIIIGALTGY